MSPNVNGDWVTNLNAIMQSLVSDKSDVFQSFGVSTAHSFGVIMIVLFGLQTALSGQGFDFNGFLRLILKYATITAIVSAYVQPVSWMADRAFPQLITDGGIYLANQIGAGSFDQLNARIAELLKNNPPSLALSIASFLMYWFVWILLQLVRAVLWVVMSWGYIGQGVCILLGPIFIPFALWSAMDWMFWNWLRTFLYFSFYPIVAAAVAHVFSTFLLNFMTSGNADLSAMIGLLPFFIVTVYGLLKTPTIVSMLFSTGGGGGGSGLGAVAKLAGLKF